MTFYIDTDHPIAVDSPDHYSPRGTRLDNHTNLRFNELLREIYGRKPSVLDFGCAGGGMVRTLINEGHTAIGLEGSDYNRQQKRAEWAVIGSRLFTVDLGFPFTLHKGTGNPYLFDVLTAWDFVEHIPEERLPALMDNMTRHIKPGGLLIGTTTHKDSIYDGIQHHLTRRMMDFWDGLFKQHHFKPRPDLVDRFHKKRAWVRLSVYYFVYEWDCPTLADMEVSHDAPFRKLERQATLGKKHG